MGVSDMLGEKWNAANVYSHIGLLVDVETGEAALTKMGQAFGPVFKSATQCRLFLEYLKRHDIIYPDQIALETNGEFILEDFYAAYLHLESNQ